MNAMAYLGRTYSPPLHTRLRKALHWAMTNGTNQRATMTSRTSQNSAESACAMFATSRQAQHVDHGLETHTAAHKTSWEHTYPLLGFLRFFYCLVNQLLRFLL